MDGVVLIGSVARSLRARAPRSSASGPAAGSAGAKKAEELATADRAGAVRT